MLLWAVQKPSDGLTGGNMSPIALSRKIAALSSEWKHPFKVSKFVALEQQFSARLLKEKKERTQRPCVRLLQSIKTVVHQ